ncbi:alpha-ketoglutarate-dependent dioxygenase AlkB [Lacihabitans sp. LS3-19]|uniref:alpha-ketoglutarate-dependent dioxygenase AlkB family protein n=1 Tax=Lacihabitans sp. LS3-19 TaxID=2487335 RepID=UPI0020CE990F|nr:alpha-ketoglutarate-dependent dioxygenase AlkB [Lacihabitans sp. LS3-19]MCP9769166.1 alpha-ketoglutarate-dependent dioxygenase AlkB [Lacihabitans sp. LS3-19]
MLSLFPSENLLPFDGEVLFYADFIGNEYFELLKSEINWKQEGMKMYGKEVLFPRLTAWYAEEGKTYKYSGLVNIPQKFTPNLLKIKEMVELKTAKKFNSALLNYYRNGQDSMGWHADDETELGKDPVIASISLGAERKFQFKHKTIPKTLINMNLSPGSLLMMQSTTQHHWLHQVPKIKEAGERINITFRWIK